MVWRYGTVTALIDESPHAKTIELEVPDWPGHAAGQHVDVRLTADDGYQAQRSYSIASSPEDPRLALTVDLYAEDWAHLKGVMVQGKARLIARGPRFRKIRARLYRKYPQYAREAALDPSDSVVIEVAPTRVFSWGLS